MTTQYQECPDNLNMLAFNDGLLAARGERTPPTELTGDDRKSWLHGYDRWHEDNERKQIHNNLAKAFGC